MTSRLAVSFVLLCISAASVPPGLAQRSLAGADETRLALERLNVLGSVLMIGAHPDDENTALLASFARGRKVRAAYLSLTRGEGGQNLIGPEQGDLMGLIRTHELLEARKIDGAEQCFTRAIDFGFTKSADETFSKWGREAVLSDIVWTIRRFQPDVIVSRFSGTPRDGHGQHQAAGILGKEAFSAAADRSRFPEQLKWVDPWQAKRILWNVFGAPPESGRAAGQVEIDTGDFDPLLGYSYSEIAGMSRSMHRSQGFGSAEHRGIAPNYLAHVAGEPAMGDIFDGVDLAWTRLAGDSNVQRILSEADATFQAEQPAKTIPLLLQARPLLARMKGVWAGRKLKDLDEAIALCAGMWLDASADRYNAVPGTAVQVHLEVINRSRFPLTLTGVVMEGLPDVPAPTVTAAALNYNEPYSSSIGIKLPPDQPYTQPFWLKNPRHGDLYVLDSQSLVGIPDSPPLLSAKFQVRAGSETIELVRPVAHRYVDRVLGEQVRPLEVVPPVAVQVPESILLFPGQRSRRLEISLVSNIESAAGQLAVEVPKGWKAEPQSHPFRIVGLGEESSFSFTITPPPGAARGELRAVAMMGSTKITSGMRVISYPHFPPQTVFPAAKAGLVRADIRTLARTVGYVMGAGDEVPQALRQMGCEVTLLGSEDLISGELSRFDAIVTGVRAFNTRADLRANFQRLLGYVQGGGTLVVQYNVLADVGGRSTLERIGPYPITIGRGRVTVDEAPVTFPNPRHALLSTPNKITSADFEGWIQERGLYFASTWDPRYEALFASSDPGEEPLKGGTLYTRYGKGAYVFTAYSWFRELPAGVPGAFRIFANFLSAGKTAQ